MKHNNPPLAARRLRRPARESTVKSEEMTPVFITQLVQQTLHQALTERHADVQTLTVAMQRLAQRVSRYELCLADMQSAIQIAASSDSSTKNRLEELLLNLCLALSHLSEDTATPALVTTLQHLTADGDEQFNFDGILGLSYDRDEAAPAW